MFSMLFTTNTPEQWAPNIAFVIILGATMGLLAWGVILKIRYINPFILIKTSNKEKWRRAAILALMQTAMFPIFGVATLILYPSPEKLPLFSLCSGLWIIVFPIAILYGRWEFETHIKRYQRFDKMIKDKNSVYNRNLAKPFISMTRIFMTAEQKRFFSGGFPDEIDEKKDGEFSGQEQSDDSKNK
jgi:hypothetical protein